MFSTCIFCHAALGANRSIEQFPVGTRLAFDAERGRLWAVCARCGRWNLAPIEERWEAVAECERAYRGARQRVSTDNIALARLGDGTDLVRIGRPLLPEFAAWRYGREFLKRSWRYLAVTSFAATGGQVAVTGGMIAADQIVVRLLGTMPPLAFAGILATGAGAILGLPFARFANPSALLLMIDDELHGLSRWDLRAMTIRRDEPGRIVARIRSRVVTPNHAALRVVGLSMRRATGAKRAEREIADGVALDMMRRALPVLNSGGGFSSDVAEAVSVLEEAPRSSPSEGPAAHFLLSAPAEARNGPTVGGIASRCRLAAEMALHETMSESRWRANLARCRRAGRKPNASRKSRTRLRWLTVQRGGSRAPQARSGRRDVSDAGAINAD